MTMLNAHSLRHIANMADLDQALAELRVSWATDWMGLPAVLNACVDALFTPHETSTDTAAKLLQAAQHVVREIENNAQTSVEPCYHNRLHIADALVGLTSLLRLQISDARQQSPDWLACLLLTVSAHDFHHPGGANAKPHEIESMSIQQLQPLLVQHGIESVWQDRIGQMILRTDPGDVQQNHARIQGQPFQWSVDWAVVLLNEADILASASAAHGVSLGLSLADEWKKAQHPLHTVVGTDQGRLNFLKSLRFSSPASAQLGIAAVVQQQVTALSVI